MVHATMAHVKRTNWKCMPITSSIRFIINGEAPMGQNHRTCEYTCNFNTPRLLSLVFSFVYLFFFRLTCLFFSFLWRCKCHSRLAILNSIQISAVATAVFDDTGICECSFTVFVFACCGGGGGCNIVSFVRK